MSSAGRNSSPRPGSRRIENRAQLAPRFVGRRGEALAIRFGEPPSDCRCEAGAFLHALEPAGYLRAIGPEVLHPEHRCAIDVRRRRGIRQAVVVAGKVGAAGDDYSLADAAATPYVNRAADRKSTRLNSSHVKSSYAVFCLKKKNK